MIGLDQLRFRFPRAAAAVEARVTLLRKALSFGLIGVLNTGVDFAVFWIGAQEFGLPLVLANTLSWSIAASNSYVMNSMVTFAAESGRKLGWRSYATFLASNLLGLVANTAVLIVIANVFAPALFTDRSAQLATGKLCAIGASFVVNFSLSHFVVFRRRVETAGEG
jgi:putative flippase GtrA